MNVNVFSRTTHECRAPPGLSCSVVVCGPGLSLESGSDVYSGSAERHF